MAPTIIQFLIKPFIFMLKFLTLKLKKKKKDIGVSFWKKTLH